MRLTKKGGQDYYSWTCQRSVHQRTRTMKSIRDRSLFHRSHLSLFQWMQFIYRFAQGLRLRQVDMMQDEIAASTTTLSSMSQKLRQVCREAVEKMRIKKGQLLGGRREFVLIDESLFRHKRKYGRGRMGGTWRRRKWVFGMLGVKQEEQKGKRVKPVLRLVERRGRQNLVPLIALHVKTGSSIISDEWRAYRTLGELGFNHVAVNHSRWYVDPRTGAHTQHIERAWRSIKEQVWRQRGNRTERLLSDHLCLVEWMEWLGRRHKGGPLGMLLHDIAKTYQVPS
ncbi:uncharacterized protein LOC127659789 [Xyrauchen texanus]|uniref:uncharacterized protein LOC127659789 n=1 Tax=Xyrauchen texanus TaxID=154827 RepID=UPI002242B9E4|nr:uncharacterized protein LOC127659789 [Xyrauchen texanus]